MAKHQRVTIIKCQCGHPACNIYGLSEGMFYQGSGWEKGIAQEYADAINKARGVTRRRVINTTAKQYRS